MRFFTFFMAALLCMALLSAKNQMEFRTYPQKVIMEFASPADAQKAQLTPTALPENYVLAVTSRWDDSNPKHLNTLQLLRKNGMTGNFYMNQTPPDLIKKMLAMGGAVGLHTVTHPILTFYAPNRIFYEYMRNRIELETVSRSCINSQALPYCAWVCSDPRITPAIGFAMRAAGVIESPDVMIFNPKALPMLGYKPETMAYAWLIMPGDTVPSFDKFNSQLKNHLNNKRGLAQNPAISMSMHSWHSTEGLKNLDEMFRRLSGHKDWWYCTQTQYGAYRYETQNCVISKKIEGNKVTFTIVRIEPAEIACAQPLWFSISVKPKAMVGATLSGNKIKLPHAPGKVLPVRFGKMQKGKSSEFPELKLSLSPAGELGWNAVLANTGKSELKDCQFTFSFSAEWEKPTLHSDLVRIEPGKNITVTVKQPSRKKELFYRAGIPYAVVRFDFTLDGKRCRLYADWTGKAVIDPATPQALAAAGLLPDGWKPETVSKTDFNLGKLEEVGYKKDPNAAEGVIAVQKNFGFRKKKLFMVLDFELSKQITAVPVKNLLPVKADCWINGKRYQQNDKISLPAGRSRFLLITGNQSLNFRLGIPNVKCWIAPLQK